jgi:hypothetical protein
MNWLRPLQIFLIQSIHEAAVSLLDFVLTGREVLTANGAGK